MVHLLFRLGCFKWAILGFAVTIPVQQFIFSKIWGEDLKELVESRGEAGHVLTIRPDSGDPATVVCKLLNILSEKFGSTQNSKGYKVLPPYLRLLQVNIGGLDQSDLFLIIQGDGIGLDSTKHILKEIQAAGFSTENVILGCGGGLLQKHNRDTLKFAFKCSLAVVNEKEVCLHNSLILPCRLNRKYRLWPIVYGP